MQRIKVLAWRRIHQRDVSCVMFIEIVNQSVHIFKVKARVRICKVTAHWNKHMISFIIGSHLVQVFFEIFGFVHGIESIPLFVYNEGIVVPEALIIPKSLRPAVMIPHCSREDLLLISKMLSKWSPQVVHGFVFESLVTVGMIKSREEPSFKAHVSKKTWICV